LARYSVIFDACVLYPAPLRDFLVQLATTNLFRAKWTDEIHHEWIENLLMQRPDLKREPLQRTTALMNEHVVDSLITGYEHLVPTITLPDQHDRHVVAAAIHAKCDAIVTVNLRDFPERALKPLNLEAIHPDDFITYQHDLDNAALLLTAQKRRNRLTKPARTAEEYLDILYRQGLPKTVAILRRYVTVL
jgi:predicted nucleic acid-binding protein